MKLLATFALKSISYYEYDIRLNGVITYEPSRITTLQHRAEPVTPEEKAAFSEGYCPKCKGKLAGDNGRFCIKDQIWWKKPPA